MKRAVAVGAALALLAAAGVLWTQGREPGVPRVELALPPEQAPMVPWREPEKDLAALFPGATGFHTETRILSGERLALQQRLGRAPTAEESALSLHRIHSGSGIVGTVLVRRVKGEYGAIEIVVGVDREGSLRAVRIQRMREPEAVAQVLESKAWLGRFRGRTAETLDPSALESRIPEAAHPSALAVAEGVRSLLILREVAERAGLKAPEAHP